MAVSAEVPARSDGSAPRQQPLFDPSDQVMFHDAGPRALHGVTRRIADRYILGGQIGAGGTSRVHVAVDERLARPVAVKLLDNGSVASADPAGRERFLREGPTSALFSHRHAVTVFDAGEDAGDLYIVMELVEGPSLAEHLAHIGPLPIVEATRIGRQVLSALAAAHAVGIVHRDVKPANVLLAPDGSAKLADFGIAKRFDDLDDSVTSIGTVIGTPRYLAPEQAAGAPTTPATDVYSMGIVLFEMLTGRTPFADASRSASAVVQLWQAAPDVRTFRPDVSPQLAATVARSLERQPVDRFPTAVEMAAHLEQSWAPPAANPTGPGSAATRLMATTEPESAVPPTVVMAAFGAGVTEILPGAPLPAAGPPRHRAADDDRPRKASAVVVAFAVLVAAVVAVVLFASGGADEAGSTLVTGPAAAAATTAVPATVLAAVPATEPAPAPAPTSPPLDEIIAGFARTNDLDVFLAQLAADPALVGIAGDALVDELRKVLDERSAKKRRDGAKELRKKIDGWVAAGELDPAIAGSLDALLADIAGNDEDD